MTKKHENRLKLKKKEVHMNLTQNIGPMRMKQAEKVKSREPKQTVSNNGETVYEESANKFLDICNLIQQRNAIFVIVFSCVEWWVKMFF